MTYSATVINVMIASPSDVETQRQIVRDVIHEWNAIHTKDRCVVLMPVGWESHACPKMGASAQEIINKDVLADCDLLVAVFWTRLGSPTGNSPSGTVAEIQKHMESGKPTMIYFSNAPVRPESVEDEQYTALLAFREECKEKGYIQSYDSISQFRDMFTRQLTQTVYREFSSNADVPEAMADHPQTRPRPVSLTDDAAKLLVEAAGDRDGHVLRIETMQGTLIQTNNRQFVEVGNARSQARWEAALEELISNGLLQDRGNQREVFGVTRKGYDVMDSLMQS